MSDKMRSEFEKWYKSQAVFHKAHLVPLPNGCYFGSVAETAWRAWQAARTVPEGYVMVPVEPTVEMNNAGYDARYGDMCDCGGSFASADEIYAAMLSAAPEGKK